MKHVKWPLALVLACAGNMALAADLIDVWQAAMQNDREYAVDRAAQATAQPRRDQATALWKPNVGLTTSIGLATSRSETRGADFSTPQLGQSPGVNFDTSVTHGTASHWAVSATQPLYDPQRSARQQQLSLSADVADLDWQVAEQSLILRTSQRYFDLALAEEAVRVLLLQIDAVQRATTEAFDSFKLGAVPITDTHEAKARLAGVRAQLLAAESDLEIKRSLLADNTGLAVGSLAARLPAKHGADQTDSTAERRLDLWLGESQSKNLALRSQRIAALVAKQEAAKYSLQSSPTVDLVAQAGRDRLSGSGDFGAASNTGSNRMIGIQLSVPLYTGGYRNAKREEALYLADKAQAEVERTNQEVAQQVRSAWLGLSVGAERVKALDEALAASAERRDATQLGHQVGQRTTLDLLSAENDVAAAQLAVAQGRVGLLMDRLRLVALVGQLDEAALRSVNLELAPAGP
jgi:outer membrane protein